MAVIPAQALAPRATATAAPAAMLRTTFLVLLIVPSLGSQNELMKDEPSRETPSLAGTVPAGDRADTPITWRPVSRNTLRQPPTPAHRTMREECV
ncbi:hypothetical protein Sm713_57610 [Streptomyces sp. TS71-3]|nr:hypothetical protein Sm713_57610 [Streptomyces sp. TS71-3]